MSSCSIPLHLQKTRKALPPPCGRTARSIHSPYCSLLRAVYLPLRLAPTISHVTCSRMSSPQARRKHTSRTNPRTPRLFTRPPRAPRHAGNGISSILHLSRIVNLFKCFENETRRAFSIPSLFVYFGDIPFPTRFARHEIPHEQPVEFCVACATGIAGCCYAAAYVPDVKLPVVDAV